MTAPLFRPRYDALIVGARCAGAATAMLLARQGARVLRIDRDPILGESLSTHALMRPAVTLLDAWGALPAIVAGGTPAVRRTRFVYGQEIVDLPIAPSGATGRAGSRGPTCARAGAPACRSPRIS